MKRPLIRMVYGQRIDLPMAMIAETVLGLRSQVRDQTGRLWTAGIGPDRRRLWTTAAGAVCQPTLADVVQVHGDVTVVQILGSELS